VSVATLDIGRREETRAAMCDHMRALIDHCVAVGVRFDGCGECGSPWLICGECKLEIDEASAAFPLDAFWEIQTTQGVRP
jgi:Zn-finger nucleic acid-binding protein